MEIAELEKVILEKLSKGLLDGMIGNEFITGDHAKVGFQKIIKDGIPQIIRRGADSKFFNNKENVRVAGKVVKELFDTSAKKLLFLQKYGWLMNDVDVKAYSALFKPKKKYK
uniref:hypothetical protein n=1 Tax=Clostridium sp. 12(A) TaxID=1163671 RepID=UPI0004652094|nr:hypothetical protein [Clostridium sp. 12(A)]